MKSRVLQALALAAFAAATLPASAGAQVQASITGSVKDVATGQPIPLASVSVVGTSLGAQTNGQGVYTIRGVIAGRVEVRALRVGYAEKRASVTAISGQAVTLDLTMGAVPTTLSPVVTTVTGEQRRVEVGNAIAQVDAAKVKETSAIGSVGDLLTARAPGVMVVPGTQIGAGTRVRIRGTSSLSLSNNPIYIIDGTRVEGTTGSSTVSVGGTLPARVNDINPEEIETIEVVRGPSAATLYGTDAANGVIVITTKRGVAGKMQVTYTTEQGARYDNNKYPDAYRAWRSGATAALTSTSSNVVQCFLSQVTANACKQDSVTKFNLYEDPETTPNGAGYRQQHSLQVGGGSEQLRYFLHGEWENDAGILKVPEFDKRYLAAHGATLRAEELSPSNQRRVTMRGNFNVTATPTLDFALNTGFTSQDTRLPTSDDSGTLGVAANTYGGPGQKYNLAANGDTPLGMAAVHAARHLPDVHESGHLAHDLVAQLQLASAQLALGPRERRPRLREPSGHTALPLWKLPGSRRRQPQGLQGRQPHQLLHVHGGCQCNGHAPDQVEHGVEDDGRYPVQPQ